MKISPSLPRGAALFALGALTARLGYPPTGFWPLAVAAPALLWTIAARNDQRRASWMGLWYGFGFFTFLIYWLVETLHGYGGLHLSLSIVALILLNAYLSLYPAIAARLISATAKKSKDGAVVIAPFLWCGLEWVRSRLFTGFGWGDTAQALWRENWALNLAPRVGAEGAGLLVMVSASGLMWLALSRCDGEKPSRRALYPSLAALFLIILLPLAPDGLSSETKPLKVAVVQGNIEQSLKWEPGKEDETINTYRSLTLAELSRTGGADLILWPETAVPVYFQKNTPERKLVIDLVKESKTPLVFGAPAFDREGQTVKTRNSVFALDQNGNTVGRYDKMHLVPFGEYVPLGKLLFFIKRLVYATGDFTPGEKTVRLEPLRGGIKVGALICFESIFPEYALEHAGNGAGLLALVTNDAWFGLTSAPWQHLSYAAWRAAESGLPLARAANTGVSAFFDRRGRLIEASAQNTPLALTATLDCPPHGAVPLSASVVPFVGPSALALALLGLFVILQGRLKLPSRSEAKNGGR